MRSLAPAVETAIAARAQFLGLLIEMDAPSGSVRAWSGVGTLSWDGKSWEGLGDLLSVSPVE